MKNIIERLEILFAAIGFAEAGEPGIAREIIEQKDKAPDIRKPVVRRKPALYTHRPAGRAA